MPDNDLIRRGDAREILEDEGFLERSLERLAALPAVTPAPDAAAIREAALREAHDAIADYPRTSPDGTEAQHYDEQIEHSQAIILALIPKGGA